VFRDKIAVFPQFMRKVFYEHDTSELNLDINRTQINILMIINESTEKSMSEISRITGLEKSSFTRSVDYLVKSGLISRNSQKNDRRIITLSLTKKGVRTASLIRKDFDCYLESLIAGFSDNEKKEFLKSLDVVSAYMNRILKEKQK
jgi:DNA-binding MarR family transcriptional regulator